MTLELPFEHDTAIRIALRHAAMLYRRRAAEAAERGWPDDGFWGECLAQAEAAYAAVAGRPLEAI
jgi:hypothetical protein